MEVTTKCLGCILRLHRSNSTKASVCVLVDYGLEKIVRGHAKKISVVLYEQDGCKPIPESDLSQKQAYWFVMWWGNCSVKKIIENAKNLAGPLIVTEIMEYPPSLHNFGIDKNVMLLDLQSYRYIVEGTDRDEVISLELLPFQPYHLIGIASLFFALVVLFCCLVGMWWSLNTLGLSKMIEAPVPKGEEKKVLFIYTSSAHQVAIFLIVLLLIGLDSFFRRFAWVIIVMLCALFTESFRSLIIEGVLRHSSAETNERFKRRFKDYFDYDLRGIFLLPFCAIPAITWIVLRNFNHVWVVQNTCGIAACIYTIKTVRMGCLRAYAEYSLMFGILGILWRVISYTLSIIFARGYLEKPMNRVFNISNASLSYSENFQKHMYIPLDILLPDVKFADGQTYEYSMDPNICGRSETEKLNFYFIIFPGEFRSLVYPFLK